MDQGSTHGELALSHSVIVPACMSAEAGFLSALSAVRPGRHSDLGVKQDCRNSLDASHRAFYGQEGSDYGLKAGVEQGQYHAIENETF